MAVVRARVTTTRAFGARARPRSSRFSKRRRRRRGLDYTARPRPIKLHECLFRNFNQRPSRYIYIRVFSFCKKKRDYRSSPKAKVLKPKQSVTNFDTRLFQSTNRSRPFIDKKNTIRLIFPFHTNRTENIYRITKAKKCTDQTQRSLRRGR